MKNKTYSAIPLHYRQVTSGTIRKGDLKKSLFGGGIRKVTGSIGKDISTAQHSTVWRRNHVAIKPLTIVFSKKSKATIKRKAKAVKTLKFSLRRLGNAELVVIGDSWAYAKTPAKIEGTVNDPKIGLTPGNNQAFVYFRKADEPKTTVKKPRRKVGAVEKNPLLTFSYPLSSDPSVRKVRQVRLISANTKYIVGLEVSDKNRFKKFLKTKTASMQVVEYSTGSMP